MACNRCGSNDLWDDNLWWGCNSCGYSAGPDGPSFIFAKAKPGLARSRQEMIDRGQINSHHDSRDRPRGDDE